MYKTQECLGIKAPKLQRRPSPWGTLPLSRRSWKADFRPGEDSFTVWKNLGSLPLSPEVYFPVAGVRGPITTEGPKRWG